MNKVGRYTVIYNAVDKAGNHAEPVHVNVIVEDTTAPTIKFEDKQYENETEMTVRFERGGEYVTPKFKTDDHGVEGKITVEEEGYINPNDPRTYIMTYYAVDESGNESSRLTVNVVVQNYAPHITYLRDGVKVDIEEGKTYRFELSVYFEGKGVLKDKEGNVINADFKSGTPLADGDYILTATLEDLASTTVSFSVNTQGPKVNITERQIIKTKQNIIIYADKDEIETAILKNKKTNEVVAEGYDAVMAYVLGEDQTPGTTYTYSLYVKDIYGLETSITSFYVRID